MLNEQITVTDTAASPPELTAAEAHCKRIGEQLLTGRTSREVIAAHGFWFRAKQDLLPQIRHHNEETQATFDLVVQLGFAVWHLLREGQAVQERDEKLRPAA